ncbi:MAG: riboflavin synthase [Candidatus Sumerlaeaceae bacterium]
MFTGLVEEIGTITSLRPQKESVELQVQCHDVLRGVNGGDSIAVDGICLTVTQFGKSAFTTFASAETLRRTNLVCKQVGHRVNLERPLTLEKRLGGHLVQGHVDGVGTVVGIQKEGDGQMWRFSIGEGLSRYLVSKGSITVDGISLTVVEAGADYFTVAVVPKTISATTFQFRRVGDVVNLEIDILGKYVYKYLHPAEEEPSEPQRSIVVDLLQQRMGS